MARLFLSNFDFEHELSGEKSAQDHRKLNEINRTLSPCWEPLSTPGDVTLHIGPNGKPEFCSFRQPEGWAPFNLHELSQENWELIPWGWSEQTVKWCQQFGLITRHPPIEVVRNINRRSFRFQLEKKLKAELKDSKCLKSLTELKRHLSQLGPNQKWVIKAEFGMSGRERVLGTGMFLAENSHRWIERRLSRGEPLVFEPWLDSIQEAGLQFEIPASGKPRHVGTAVLLTDRGGVYRGSRFNSAQDEAGWEEGITIGLNMANHLKGLGYFGPLGIDAMWYRGSDGTKRFRVLQDLNARMTMGRLALEWKKLLAAGECGSWLHLRNQESDLLLETVKRELESHPEWPSGARVVRMSQKLQTEFFWILIGADSVLSRERAEQTVTRRFCP